LSIKHLEADYLVIGCGAVAMSFVDTILSETKASVIMIDRRHAPGGHWNDAYPYVRLHQPSNFYGVCSRELGSNRIDESGPNKGFHELATGKAVQSYFEQVMRERFLPSGRVQYFPMCEYTGDGQFHSLLSSDQYTVSIAKKTVDCAYYETSIPLTHTRKFEVDPEVSCIPPNDLPRSAAQHQHYTVLGGGKTGMDSITWLLGNGVDPNAITWVCSRSSWVTPREIVQADPLFFKATVGGQLAIMRASAAATSVDDLFERLEASKVMARIDTTVKPTMYHYAVVSNGELEQLRQVKSVVYGAHIKRISTTEMELTTHKPISAKPNTLYIDCTATAARFGDEVRPIFNGDLITPQCVIAPLIPYSAAIVAFVEANFETDAEKNTLCPPVSLADTPAEWMKSFSDNVIAQNRLSQNPKLSDWTKTSRLEPFGRVKDNADENNVEHMEILKGINDTAESAIINLHKLMAEVQ
jgi:hypothetical protein